MQNFQSFTLSLIDYWTKQGCLWTQPYDHPMGAGTFHPHTFLKGLGPEPWRSVYVQPCRRPVDGRYGENPYRFQHYYQLQVLLKPAPSNIIDVFLKSLEHVGIRLEENDISLLEDDWKGPTLGAWGLGWEVRANGQEVTQFTYFQQLGGLDLDVISGEITYGLERLYLYRYGLKSALDIPYNDQFTYGDIYKQNEFEFSHFNFKQATVSELLETFSRSEENVKRLCEQNLVLPAYDYVLQASHAFNLLDARGAISVAERQRYIGRVRDCARLCAQVYRAEREARGFPLMNRVASQSVVGGAAPMGSGLQVSSASSSRDWTAPTEVGAKPVDVLLELGVEEIPPAFQVAAQEQIESSLKAWREKTAKTFAGSEVFLSQLRATKFQVLTSARRISLLCEGLPCREPDLKKENWGPAERIAKAADGSFSQAALGFAKKSGIDPSALQFKSKSDGTFLYFEKNEPGRDFPKQVAEEFFTWVEAIESGLKMKWSVPGLADFFSFVRPVRTICAMVGNQRLAVTRFGVESGKTTFGQRVLSPQSIELKGAAEYEHALTQAGVMVDTKKRQALILDTARSLAESKKGMLGAFSEKLAEKTAGLTESPVVFLGKMDSKYLRLPARLISSALREHMNYFSVLAPDGLTTLPYYIGVAGYQCTQFEKMVEATSVVVTGRLEDGAFYFDQDLQTSVEEFHDRLGSQTFQAGMGTLKQKAQRVSLLASRLAKVWPRNGADSSVDFAEIAGLAGLYSKADLRSGCVQEFPDEMQGVMGGILINHQKPFGDKSARIAEAVSEHYSPAGAADSLPKSQLGKLVSLADKLDSLVFLLGSGNEVKGNKDPFGLRRMAVGVVRILGLDGELDTASVGFSELSSSALAVIEGQGFSLAKDTLTKVNEFLLGRVKAAWKNEFNPGAIEAVSKRIEAQSIVVSRNLVRSLSKALESKTSGLAESLTPYKRCVSLTDPILGRASEFVVDAQLIEQAEERALFEVVKQVELRAEQTVRDLKFDEYFALLASVGAPLGLFFDKVLVNHDDVKLKNNRLALLLKIRKLYDHVADFSKIQLK